MSYILDALKKAERERGLTEVPRIDTVYGATVKKKTGAWIVAGIGVLCLIIAGGLFIFMSSGQFGSKTPAAAALNQGSAVENSAPPSVNNDSIVQSSSAPPVSTDMAINQPKQETANAPVFAAPEIKQRTAVVEPARPDPKAGTETTVASISDAAVSKSPAVADTAGLLTPAAAKPAAAVREQQQASGNMPSLREIANSMKKNMGIHVYSDNPEKRLVFINGKRYREGDSLEQDCILEEITAEGVILKRKEETVVLRLDGSL
jgi:general secretion pathway protein B